jgi:hypothetical protein
VVTAIYKNYSVGPLTDFPPLPDLGPFPGPEGGSGLMGIREVIDNGNIFNQDDCNDSLTSGAGTIVDYTASVLNIQDSGPNGHFGGDDVFGVVTATHRVYGDVNDISLVAKGTVEIPADGDYTFCLSTDDGFTLQFPGHDVTAIYGAGEIIPFANGSALTFWGTRPLSDTFGIIRLPPGDRQFVLTYHEHAIESSVEFSAAPGVRAYFDGDFLLIGSGEMVPAKPPVPNPPLINDGAGWPVTMVYEPYTAGPNFSDELDSAIANVDAAWAGTLPGPNTVVTAIANWLTYEDPQASGGGIGGKGFPKEPFPGSDDGINNNNFAMGAGARPEYELTDEFDYWEDRSSHSYAETGRCLQGAYICDGDDASLRIGAGTSGTGSARIIVSVTPYTDELKLRYKAPWVNSPSDNTLYVDGVDKGSIVSNSCNWQEIIITGISAYTADGLVEIRITDEVLGLQGDVQITYLEVYSLIRGLAISSNISKIQEAFSSITARSDTKETSSLSAKKPVSAASETISVEFADPEGTGSKGPGVYTKQTLPDSINLNGTNTTIVVETGVAILGSVLSILDSMPHAYDFVQTSDLSTIDFSPYKIIILGMDGGQTDEADMAHLATYVNAGAKLILLGGSNYTPFAQGLNDNFIQINVASHGWTTVSGVPDLTVVNSAHPLAAGLPITYDFVNNNATYYMARITDSMATVVAENGDGYPSLVYKLIGLGELIYFINVASQNHWADAGDYAILQQVLQNALLLPLWETIMTIYDEGDYTFLMYGDDSSQFRILDLVGGDPLDWDINSDDMPPAAEIVRLADGTGFRFHGCCVDAKGTIHLFPGDYNVQVMFNERAGGAFFGLWSSKDGSRIFLLGDTTPVPDAPEIHALELMCPYMLLGDANHDCKVNWLDIAIAAMNWLTDCTLTPGDPACIPK